MLSFEEMSMTMFPALQTMLYDGWVIRFADGYSNRSNSVNPVYGSTLPIEEKIQYCESLFAQKGLPAVFKMTKNVFPESLDTLLVVRGFEKFHETSVQTADLQRCAFDATPDSQVIVGSQLGMAIDQRTWFDLYVEFNKIDPKHVHTSQAILAAILAKPIYIALLDNGEPVACGMCVMQGVYAGFQDIVVKPDARGKGYGKQLMQCLMRTAQQNGANTAWLQVMYSNPVAMQLYAGLGFSEIYTYWYRRATAFHP